MKRLDGRIALVTGGAGHIGRATARRLQSEGAHVVIADIATDQLELVADELGEGIVPMELDAANVDAVQTVIDQTVERFGGLDILHNNHAWLDRGMPDDGNVVTTPFEVWDKTMAINLRGYFAAAKFALPHMIRRGAGAIINMTTTGALAADTDHVSYGVSKAGVIALTRFIASSHGREGIRCNAIAPGAIVHPMVERVSPDLVAVVGRQNLTPYHGEPDDIAALVAFLASSDAKFITGQIIACDGGLLTHMPYYMDLIERVNRAAED